MPIWHSPAVSPLFDAWFSLWIFLSSINGQIFTPVYTVPSKKCNKFTWIGYQYQSSLGHVQASKRSNRTCHVFVRYCINLFPWAPPTPLQFSLGGMVFALNLRMSRGIGLKKIRMMKIITWHFFVHSCLRRDQHCYPPQCLLLLPNQKTDTAQLLCPSLCGFCDHGTIFAWNFDKNVRKITS